MIMYNNNLVVDKHDCKQYSDDDDNATNRDHLQDLAVTWRPGGE